jgi:hypothetical protein
MLADKLRLYAQATSIVAEQSANLVLIERARPMLQFKFSTRPCALVSVPQIPFACLRAATLARFVAGVVLPNLRLVVQDDVQQGAADF